MPFLALPVHEVGGLDTPEPPGRVHRLNKGWNKYVALLRRLRFFLNPVGGVRGPGPALLERVRAGGGGGVSGCARRGRLECVVEGLDGVELSVEADFVVHVDAGVDGVTALCCDDDAVGAGRVEETDGASVGGLGRSPRPAMQVEDARLPQQFEHLTWELQQLVH
jgi:hypothetical protein